MASKSVEILKKILLSFRRNWGLKLISLLFAVILWNYVIVEIDPIRPQSFQVPVTSVGMTPLKNNNLFSADLSRKVDVIVELRRSEASSFNSNNITVTADFSNITGEGTQKITLKATPTKGTVKSITPATIDVQIEKREKRFVPVKCNFVNQLPADYWQNELKCPDKLEISGASSEVSKVSWAEVTLDLANITESVSRTLNYTLYDNENQPIKNIGGLDFPKSGIVSIGVLKTKAVKVDVTLVGDAARGYQFGEATCDPKEITIAGRADVVDLIESVKTAPVNVSGASKTQVFTCEVELPKNVVAKDRSAVNVTVPVTEKTVEKTLKNLPVTVRGLGSGLTADIRFRAAAVVTCAELMEGRVRSSTVSLSVDATGLEAGTHTLKILPEYADGITVYGIRIDPETIDVLIKASAP